jgi:restriction system protein
MQEIDLMSGYQFEQLIIDVYERFGYSVDHTALTGYQGLDLILTKRWKKTAVQVKRCSGSVSNGAVQEVLATKKRYKYTDGMVVTNSYFTDSAKELAKANGIHLVDRDELQKLIMKVRPEDIEAQFFRKV